MSFIRLDFSHLTTTSVYKKQVLMIMRETDILIVGLGQAGAATALDSLERKAYQIPIIQSPDISNGTQKGQAV